MTDQDVLRTIEGATQRVLVALYDLGGLRYPCEPVELEALEAFCGDVAAELALLEHAGHVRVSDGTVRLLEAGWHTLTEGWPRCSTCGALVTECVCPGEDGPEPDEQPEDEDTIDPGYLAWHRAVYHEDPEGMVRS